MKLWWSPTKCGDQLHHVERWAASLGGGRWRGGVGDPCHNLPRSAECRLLGAGCCHVARCKLGLAVVTIPGPTPQYQRSTSSSAVCGAGGHVSAAPLCTSAVATPHRWLSPSHPSPGRGCISSRSNMQNGLWYFEMESVYERKTISVFQVDEDF